MTIIDSIPDQLMQRVMPADLEAETAAGSFREAEIMESLTAALSAPIERDSGDVMTQGEAALVDRAYGLLFERGLEVRRERRVAATTYRIDLAVTLPAGLVLIEAKTVSPWHGIGQLLFYEAILGESAGLVLAVPPGLDSPALLRAADRASVEVWAVHRELPRTLELPAMLAGALRA